MNAKTITATSKYLSFVLRHAPESIGITLDAEGWTDIDTLITKANAHGGRQTLTRELIQVVVDTNEKKRFTIFDNQIRAAQGHSTDAVNIQYAEKTPPDYLFHGTATRFMDLIDERGLIPMSRHHVHMTQDQVTAVAVGRRYGEVVLLRINTVAMLEQGFKFFQADNGVWLVDHVPPHFFERITMEHKQ